MKIIPAILAESFEDFTSRLRSAESFAGFVQVDIMDGEFVPTRSFHVEELNSVRTALEFEVHLMAARPQDLAARIKNPGLRQVIFHSEADLDRMDFIRYLRARGLGAGLALRPETGLEGLEDIAAEADGLLFLTVEPGAYGSTFRPGVLDKVARARRLFPGKTIAVDGGVSLDNLKEIAEAGADRACVGSRIFLDKDPGGKYRQFAEKARELEAARAGRRG